LARSARRPSVACSRQWIRWSSDYLRVPLKLVTGPANAAKAGEVLGALRARLDDDPILVVPTFADVEHAQRELAERGAVFGPRVMQFKWLFDEIAARAGFDGRKASDFQRELIVDDAVRGARLEVLAESAAQPGFVRAAAHFVAELTRSMVEPARFTAALRRWAGEGSRRTYADEIAAVYRAYRGRLDAAGLVDADLFAWRAVEALRRERAWIGTPLFVYGFDDFTPVELRALDTIANWCDAEVTVSLPYEPGRLAFKAVSAMHQELLALGADELKLPPLEDHYADESRSALHHLERQLFEVEPVGRVDPGAAISFHSAGGERAEVELAAARVLDLLRAGVTPGDVAVVFRDPGRYSSLLEQVFGAYGIPYSIDRKIRFGHTGLGRGLLALIRAAGPDGTADDLLAYLRTPGLLRVPGFADSLEAEVRRSGAHRASEARAVWERDRWPLVELDRLVGARDTEAFVAELEGRLASLFAAPYKRTATVLSGPQLEEARALSEAQRALTEFRAVLGARPLDAAHALRVVEQLEVHVGERPQPDRVQVADPGEIRARRFEAVLCCGLQEGEFPRTASPEPFLSDDDRRALATASGLVLPVREDRLDRERYLFYVCASRAERTLVLSSRSSDEEGNPQTESYFVDDVRELLDDGAEVRTRSLAEVTWRPDEAPTAAELDRAHAATGPRLPLPDPVPLSAEPLLELLSARDAVAARALENFADCPVKWLVEDVLKPAELVPDPEAMVRGSYAHEVLHHTYRRLREETGVRRVTHENLSDAERILLEELRQHSSSFQLSPKQTRVRAAARRLEFDLLRFLRTEADSDSRFEPVELERDFGFGGADPVELDGGLRVRGRIDRVDEYDGMALVIDYKTGRRVDRYKVASWEPENRFQAALYMLVVEKLLGLRPAGGVYVALGSDDSRPRGMVAKDVDELGKRWVDTDRLDVQAFREKLDWALGRIRETDALMRAGELRACPDRCDWNGGCKYPSVCRSER
jgi:ATP-dependent helicase/DNAse subunit B